MSLANKRYSNFVRASLHEQAQCLTATTNQRKPNLSGDEARRIYLEEIKDGGERSHVLTSTSKLRKSRKVHKEEEVPFANKDLILTVQNNDVDSTRWILDKYPDKINIVDDYGWSLLMIACQANSIDSAKELLMRGIDISIRDKAGNSARGLVIKNRNYALADILLNYRETESKSCIINDRTVEKSKSAYTCDICNNTFPDKEEHLSSTVHNISASKGKKIPANYVIPTSNRGYQLLLKGGWDRESGLGRDGTGKKYPIKTVQKKDRKGLGHRKIQNEVKSNDSIKHSSRNLFADHCKKNRRFEINFRREFY